MYAFAFISLVAGAFAFHVHQRKLNEKDRAIARLEQNLKQRNDRPSTWSDALLLKHIELEKEYEKKSREVCFLLINENKLEDEIRQLKNEVVAEELYRTKKIEELEKQRGDDYIASTRVIDDLTHQRNLLRDIVKQHELKIDDLERQNAELKHNIDRLYASYVKVLRETP